VLGNSLVFREKNQGLDIALTHRKEKLLVCCALLTHPISVLRFTLSILSNQDSPDEKIFTTRDERGFFPYTPHPTPSFKTGETVKRQ
jgi:hypothetical protein